MLLYVFIILAGNAVKCDDASNNYYVIEMPEEDVPLKEIKKPFDVYWNVPTMQCKSKKIPFTNLYEKYGIIQNSDDSFRGEEIAILYDPGLFPALLKNETSGKFKFRNGGVPQEGNVNDHLDAFRLTMEQSIPDVNFKGVGIIDFESWRPIFRQNFGVLVPYKDVSYEIEKKTHWWWPKTWIQEEAMKRFESAGRVFMQNTLSIAKQMRPKARWGYYGFPYCFNMAANNLAEKCATNVLQENNRLDWLWSESTALYPSVYSSKNLTSKQLAALVRGRVAEASRTRKGGSPILPYFWFRYRDGGFMSELDLETVLKTLYKSNASGFIIWGSSNDVNTVNKCNKLESYMDNVMGPAIAKYVKQNRKVKDEMTTDDSDYLDETVTKEPTNNDRYKDTKDTTTYQPLLENTETEKQNETLKIQTDNAEIQLDPEFHWVPPETYNQDIIRYVEEEFKLKSKHNSSFNAKHEHTYIFKENLVIDMLLNALSNSKSQMTTASTDALISPENTPSNNFQDSTTQINMHTSTSIYPTVSLSTTAPILAENIETSDRPTLSGNTTGTTEESKLITVDDNKYRVFNTFTSENNENVSTHRSTDGGFIELTDESLPSSHEYSTVTSIGIERRDETSDISSTQSDYIQFDNFEIVTEILNTSTDNVKLYTEDYDNYLDTNTSTEINISSKIDSITVYSNNKYEADTEVELGSIPIADLDLSTQSTVSITSKLNVPFTSTNSFNTTESTTLNEIYEFDYIDEEGKTDNNSSSFHTEVSVSQEHTESSTEEFNLDFNDNATALSMLEAREENVTRNVIGEEITEENFTSFSPSTSLPDKVVVYIL